VNVATVPAAFRLTVPATTVPFASTATELSLTVTGFTAALNVTTTGVVTATFVEPLGGVTLNTVGPVVTGVDELDVVNPLVSEVAAFPARSVNPPTVTVYAVDTASELAGLNSSVVALGCVTVPATATPPAVTAMAL
jgi:hypothetical protein